MDNPPTPLYLNSIGKKKSLLISIYLLPLYHKTLIPMNALVDCGCTTMCYADRLYNSVGVGSVAERLGYVGVGFAL